MGVRVQIIGEDKDDVQERGVTFYHISVSDITSGLQWDVRKRYTDFWKLDRRLRGNGELETIDLPSKGLVGFRHRLNIGEFNEKRLAGLSSYLDHLSKQTQSLMTCPALSDFLEGSARGLALWTTASNMVAHTSVQRDIPVRVVTVDAGTTPWSGEPGLHGTPEQRGPLCRASRGTNIGLDCFSGKEWLDFEASQPAVASAIERCARLLESNAFENDSEASFSALRRSLLAALRPRTGSGPQQLALETVPAKSMVWEFLLLIRYRRAFYRNQADEIISILEENGPWREALDEHEELRLLRARFV